MKIGLAIIARMGSSRLPGKHLRSVLTDGTSFFRALVGRLKSLDLPIVLATGTDPKDDQLIVECGSDIATYRGYDHNVPMRILSACKSQKWDAIIPIDGDDILISLDAIEAVCAELLSGESYVATSGLPFGMNASGFSLNVLLAAR
jgi:spore coat polysaccharide biosynthesis protein SpsF